MVASRERAILRKLLRHPLGIVLQIDGNQVNLKGNSDTKTDGTDP